MSFATAAISAATGMLGAGDDVTRRDRHVGPPDPRKPPKPDEPWRRPDDTSVLPSMVMGYAVGMAVAGHSHSPSPSPSPDTSCSASSFSSGGGGDFGGGGASGTF